MTDTKKGAFPWQHIPTPGKIYGTATVGERGQISIPAEARRELSINPGDRIVVFGNRLNGSVVLMKADIFEDFAEFFMTKLNKLGEHAQEFFDLFTVETSAAADSAETQSASASETAQPKDEEPQL